METRSPKVEQRRVMKAFRIAFFLIPFLFVIALVPMIYFQQNLLVFVVGMGLFQFFGSLLIDWLFGKYVEFAPVQLKKRIRAKDDEVQD